VRLPPLRPGRILRRYKRFLADVELHNGTVVVAHCPNTGSMASCWRPGAPVELSYHDSPRRRLNWTLERVDMGRGWVGVHTGRVNAVIREAVQRGQIGALSGYREILGEPRFDNPLHPRARLDLLLRGGRQANAYVEVKNATLLVGDAVRFPDAVTERGRKHLQLLTLAARQGYRAAIVFAINRPEGRVFEPARDIDPQYADALEAAAQAGVMVIAARLHHSAHGIAVRGCAAFPAGT
jgi:sugar fermentation stimulation protein A